MNTRRNKILIAAAVAIVLVLALPVTNLLARAPSGTEFAQRGKLDPAGLEAANALERKCGVCHVPGIAPPFYAGLPVASSLVHADIKKGTRELDLAADVYPEASGLPNEASLAKIEYAVGRDEMPPGRYLLLHWNGQLTQAEKKALEGWIFASRARHAAPGASPEQQRNVIRPLPEKVAVDARKAELGRKLYHDKRLSGDDTISCATCHDLALGGTDRAKASTGIRGQVGGINAPTTFNAGYQIKQFWDGRAATLEEQAGGPPNNPIEMGANWEQIVGKLAADEALTEAFRAAYPDGWNAANITHAIAEFERTLVTPNSRFDRYLRGEQGALQADEQKGYEAFVARGCATCHVGELLGGRSFELLGVRGPYFEQRGNLTEADNGRYNATKNEADRRHFKVPTLRNIALTAPYMHDGSAPDLAQAVRIMANAQLGQQWSDGDVQAMSKFLGSLTGEFEGKPL